MNDIIMYGAALAAVFIVGFMLIKKMDIKISLFFIGIVLMFTAIAMGRGIAIKDFASTGAVFLDPLSAVVMNFKSTLSKAGFIILILGGYSAYMTSIDANDVTVSVLTKPISKIKSVYILVPIVFLLGNILSLVIPSASNLSIILLATLYPVLKRSGMSTLTAAAVIATTATVMPTPLGSDNVAVAQELAKLPEYAGLTVTEYVVKYHAMISIPTILIMAVAHAFWQKFMDKKESGLGKEQDIEVAEIREVKGGKLFRVVYATLPVLPIFLLIISYILSSTAGTEIAVSVEVATIFSFIIAIICQLIRKRNVNEVLQGTESFFKGMGNSISIVALLVAATVFVTGLKSIGIIEALQNAMVGIQGTSLGFVLPLILVLLTALIVLISGSGTALFFAMIPLMAPLALAAGIDPVAVTIPMGLAGNLFRAISPVSAVVVIVAGSVKKNPLEIVKRTTVPMLAGVIFMFIASMILFL